MLIRHFSTLFMNSIRFTGNAPLFVIRHTALALIRKSLSRMFTSSLAGNDAAAHNTLEGVHNVF